MYGKVKAFIVRDDVCLLQKGTTKCVLGFIGGSSNGKITSSVVNARIVCSQFKIERCIGEFNSYRFCAGSADGNSNACVLCKQRGMLSIIDKIQFDSLIILKSKCVLKRIAYIDRQPYLRYTSINE